MPDEPDDLVLVIVREVRGKIEALDKSIVELRHDVAEIRKDHAGLRTWVQVAIGMGMTNQLKSSEPEARLAELERPRP